MKNYINIFEKNLNFTKSNLEINDENLFFYKLENFDIFDTIEYEKFCIGLSQIISQHVEKNIFDKELLADIIHANYGMSRTYILEKENLKFLHDGSSYTLELFNEHIEIKHGLSFVDYSLYFFSYLLQQYSLTKEVTQNNIKDYILNKKILS